MMSLSLRGSGGALDGRRVVLAPGALLCLTGLGLVWLSSNTPQYLSEAAFSQAYQYGDTASFWAALERYETNKFRLADVGYLCLAWGALLGAISLVPGNGALGLVRTGTRNWPIVLVLAIIGFLAVWLGLIAGILYEFRRFEVPPWADSIGIPLAYLTSFSIGLSLLLAPFLLAPLWLKRTPAGLFRWNRSRRAAIMAGAIYGVPMAITLLLTIWSTLDAGGYAISIGGGILTWLLLNAISMIGGEVKS